MSSDYYEEFLRESDEQITELNNALLALESDADDSEAMDAVFRTAHTLKGNAAALGFDDISGVAHAIEDLLDEIRTGNIDVTPEVMDLVFAGVDRIEEGLAEIESEGEVHLVADDLVANIRKVIEDAGEAAGETGGGDRPTGAPDEPDESDEEAGRPTREELLAPFDAAPDPTTAVHARLTVESRGMKGVDAMLVLDELEERFDLVETTPPPAALEDGDYEDGFAFLLETGEDPADVEEVLASLGPVESATVTDLATPDGDGERDPRDGDGERDPRDGDGDLATPDAHADSAAGDAVADAGAAHGEADDVGADDGEGASPSVDDVKSVRVDIDQLDELYGLVEQLVTSRIKLRRKLETEDVAAAIDVMDELDKISSNLQDTVMDMQLIPLKKIVGKFPRLVRDLAREQDKEVAFVLEGEDIELDRTILTRISDPLMHILRNAIDHGIEPPEERERRGKPREGTVALRATRQRDHVIIEVEDDGGGLDTAAIREQAREQDIHTPEELDAMAETDVYDLVFHPGFSTSEEVTNVSGRGVGMDVVHSTVKQLDGSVNVESTPGEGTTVTLRLPVTVAIVTVLFVRVGDQRFGVPIKAIDEIGRAGELRTVNQREVVEHGDDLYPVVRLAETLDAPTLAADGGETADADGAETTGAGSGDGMLLRIRESERRIALYCDAVEDQKEVVVKPLEGVLSGTPGLSGTAVLGDGNVVPILDVLTV